MDQPPQNVDDSRPRVKHRLPTVDEALQYTPLTSIVPYNHETVPTPTVAPAPTTLPFTPRSDAESDTSGSALLNSLDYEASQGTKTSERLHKTLQDLRHLLTSGDFTQYTFRQQKSPAQDTTKANGASFLTNGNSGSHQSGSKLGSFATRALDFTNVQYSYSSNTFQARHPHATSQRLKIPQQPRRESNDQNTFATQKSPPRPGVPNDVPISLNSTNANLVPVIIPPPPQPTPAIFVPNSPPVQDMSQYQTFPELDKSIIAGSTSPSKKRKRQEDDLLPNKLSRAQREQGEAALNELQDLMISIFEAEDNLQPDTSGARSKQENQLFVPGTSGNGEHFVLGSDVLTRLNTVVANTISCHKFQDIEIDYLSRMQKLLHGVMDATQGIDLTIPTSSDDIEYWKHRLEAVESNLEATKALLRIMTSGRDEKELYSEEVLQRLLNNLKTTIESCIIPVAELRTTSTQGEMISTADARQILSNVLQKSNKVLKLLGNLLLKIEISENSVVLTEYLAVKLIFVENSSSEKESIFGVQKFENFRRNGMDLLTRVFFRRPEQRRPIFDEILSSLEKLPVTRQSARHYKIIDGKPIQLVSALIMQLVQTSAVKVESSKQSPVKDEMDDSDEPENLSAEDSDDSSKTRQQKKPHQQMNGNVNGHHLNTASVALQNLVTLAKPLNDSAQKNATYVVHYLVQRALTSTKSGDQPYRNLLDIFTEDFVSVLGSMDWPAAELLLRMLLTSLVGICDDSKSTAPAKNMALDLMGVIGSGIADVQSYVNRTFPGLDSSETELGHSLSRLGEELATGKTSEDSILDVSGPFRAVMEYLSKRAPSDIQVQNALQFYLIQWARNIWTAADSRVKEEYDDGSARTTTATCSKWLLALIDDFSTLEDDLYYNDIPSTHAKLAYALSVLSMPLGRASKRIFSILLSSLTSQHATVRSRSLKSVDQLVDKDPSILDRAGNIIMHILRSASDQSPMVRDSALNLVGKCIGLKPALENKVVGSIIAKCSDSATSVRKRVLKLLKDIYLRNKDKEIKIAIAEAFLLATIDAEDSVNEIAQQNLEEIWLYKYYHLSDAIDNSAQAKGELTTVAALVAAMAQRGDGVFDRLESFFQDKLGEDCKSSSANRKVVKAWTRLMFDGIIENDPNGILGNQQNILHTLTVFAKAWPRLFNTEQMVLLRPYIENLATSDDLLVYRAVIVIYRRVLPVLPPLQHEFLKNVQQVLFSSVSRLGKLELREVAECLSIIDDVLQNTERLVRLMISVLTALKKGNEPAAKVKRYIMIAGSFGKACDLEEQAKMFKEKLPWWNGDSVSALTVEILCPYADSSQAEDVRENALESICLVCQASPKNFLPRQVNQAFEFVFSEGNVKLQHVVLAGIREFYALEEERSKTSGDNSVGEGTAGGLKRLSKSMTSENDGATTSIAQHFLSHVLRLAVASQDDLALVATDIITSTNRQGLVHPRECAPTLVALETSPNAIISKKAFDEHRSLHHKHESMLEKEYLRAIEQAYTYQQTITNKLSVSGVNFDGSPKLHLFYEVLKTGSPALRRKLLANICVRLDFHINKLIQIDDIAGHLTYARFVLENIGLFEYARVDEVLATCDAIEKIFSNTGNVVSQHIERQLGLSMNSNSAQQYGLEHAINGESAQYGLRQLSIASVLLSILWETRTYLRQTWSLQSYVSSKKLIAKDANKAPVRSSSSTPDKLLDRFTEIMADLVTEDAMRERCQAFVELLAVDNEHRVEVEDEGDNGSTRLSTPSEEGKEPLPFPPSGGSKGSMRRKGSASATPTPQKPKMTKRPSLGGRRKSSSVKFNEDADGWD